MDEPFDFDADGPVSYPMHDRIVFTGRCPFDLMAASDLKGRPFRVAGKVYTVEAVETRAIQRAPRKGDPIGLMAALKGEAQP